MFGVKDPQHESWEDVFSDEELGTDQKASVHTSFSGDEEDSIHVANQNLPSEFTDEETPPSQKSHETGAWFQNTNHIVTAQTPPVNSAPITSPLPKSDNPNEMMNRPVVHSAKVPPGMPAEAGKFSFLCVNANLLRTLSLSDGRF